MPVSTTARQSMYAQETGEVFLILLTIDHDDLAAPIRVVNNTENLISGAAEFVAYPFDLVLPDSDEDREIIARLTIDNVSREIAQAIRGMIDPPTVIVEVVRASALNSPELTLPTFFLRNVQWDALTISGDLVLGDITTEPYPAHTFDPGHFPGLF